MSLSQIKGLNSRVRNALNKDGWTVEKLATTTAPKLARVRGISLAGAGKIIEQAREIVNQPKYNPQPLDNGLTGPVAPSLTVEPQMSPRVRRILMASKGKE